MIDIIDLVLEDHHTVEGLFDKLQAATGAVEQANLFSEVREALERHAAAEEKVLYPWVRKDVPHGKAEVKDAEEEHEEIRNSLRESQSMRPEPSCSHWR